MLKRFCFVLCFVLMFPTVAYAEDFSVSAYSCVAIDANTGSIIYEKNAYSQLPMASTTKIMTCLIACESNKLDDLVTVTNEMLNGTEGSLIYLEAGDEISLLDLIKGAMLASGNDAANAIAVYLGGSIDSFVDMMNKKADDIGMKNTYFATPSGLDKSNHHSTAYDMAILASYALDNSTFSSVCKLKSANITVNDEERTIYNHNKLLSISDGFIGVKTGYTEKSGRCLVSAYDYNGNKIIIVTLNDSDDWNDHQRLVDYAKKYYKKYAKTNTISISVVGAKQQSVACSAKYEVYAYSSTKIIVKDYYYPFIYAPVEKGEIVGYEIITNNNSELLQKVPIKVSKGINNYG